MDFSELLRHIDLKAAGAFVSLVGFEVAMVRHFCRSLFPISVQKGADVKLRAMDMVKKMRLSKRQMQDYVMEIIRRDDQNRNSLRIAFFETCSLSLTFLVLVAWFLGK